MVVTELECANGEKVCLEETPYYYKMTVGNRTWYWNRDTGEFDGTSYQVGD